MSGHIEQLRMDLEKTLISLDAFRDFVGALDSTSLEILFKAVEAGPEGRSLNVAVRDSTGFFYRGRLVGHSESGSFSVRADDGELVHGIPAHCIVAARIQDTK
jgi:hypothetical protein